MSKLGRTIRSRTPRSTGFVQIRRIHDKFCRLYRPATILTIYTRTRLA